MLPRLSLRTLSLALFATLPTTQLYAADLLPLGALEHGANGNVSSADTGITGSVKTGVSFQSSATVARPAHLPGLSHGEAQDLVRDANRINVFAGSALTKSLSLTLGLHGTYEHVKPDSRDALFPLDESEAGDGEAALTWRESLKQTAFSGASLALKWKLFDAEGLKLGLMPFLESGAGERASFALTRSVSPKAGFMGLATYGAAQVAEVSLNAGMRYRSPEEIGGLVVRNEAFYRMAIEASLLPELKLFATADGRRLMTKAKTTTDAAAVDTTYAPNESGEALGGLKAVLGDASIAAFGGGRFEDAKGFGYGARTYGVSLTMVVGGDRRAPKKSYAAELEKAEDAKKPLPVAAPLPPKEPNLEDEYPEMIGKDIDPLDAVKGVEGQDDFSNVEKTILENEKAGKTLSEDDKIELELKEIRAAEAKAAEERAVQERKELQDARRKARSKAKKDDALMKEWMDEAKKDVDGMGGITKDEMEWNGLE